MILPLMEHWLTRRLFKPEVKTQIMKALTISLQSFGIYKPDLFYQFFAVNQPLIEEIEYL
jgi:hypothetical protein